MENINISQRYIDDMNRYHQLLTEIVNKSKELMALSASIQVEKDHLLYALINRVYDHYSILSQKLGIIQINVDTFIRLVHLNLEKFKNWDYLSTEEKSTLLKKVTDDEINRMLLEATM